MSPESEPPRHVVVVGGGIAGLAAAHALTHAAETGLSEPQSNGNVQVTVLEATGQVGGKLRLGQLAGVPIDVGAESLLLRRPEAVELAREVGLGPDLTDAATTNAAVWTRGALRTLPAGTVMGVPSDIRALAASGLLTRRELARVPVDAWLPRTEVGADIAVGRYVAARLGRGVVDRLVEPLLGGVYAGRADELSLEATVPQLAPHARADRSLLAAARKARAETTAAEQAKAPGAVFGAPRGGVARLPEAVAHMSGATIRTGTTVRELDRTATGWRLVVGPTRSPEEVLADAVVLALPAAPTARLVGRHSATAGAELASIRYASMAVVALAFPVAAFPHRPTGSGFLVPPVEGRTVKAVTFTSTKWAWYAGQAPDLVLLRASVGRVGEESVLQREDADLVDLVLADLADLLGLTATPIDATVTRWGGGLPQYAVGHRTKVERVRAAVATLPGLAVAGAAYDGVGIPACVASGRRAAAEVLRQWRA